MIAEKPSHVSWEMTTRSHGNQGWATCQSALTPVSSVASCPDKAGTGLRGRPVQQLHTTLGVPRDPRGIVLACGFAGAGAVGVGVLLVAKEKRKPQETRRPRAFEV